MANILEEIHNELPDFPANASVEQQLEFLYEQLDELNRKLQTAAEDAPDGATGTFTSADTTPKTVTVTDGIISSIV